MGWQRVRHKWATFTIYLRELSAKAPLGYCRRDPFTVCECGIDPFGPFIVVGAGDGTPLQYSCLENTMDGGGWWAAVHGVAKSRTWLSDFTCPFHFHALEEEMATLSSVLAWRIPGMGEPNGLRFMGSHRVGHDWSDLVAVVVVVGFCVLCLSHGIDTSSF